MISGKDIFFRSHNFADLCGSVTKTELTEKQKETLKGLLGKISLTEPQAAERDRLIAKRDAKPELDATGKALIEQLHRELIRGTYTPKVESDYLKKGLAVELHAITRIANVNGWGLCRRYDGLPKRDEIGEGTPDVFKEKTLLGFDAKSSFTDKTFPLWWDELKEKKYEIQAKRYAMIFGVDEWYVCYSLENSPEHIVLKDAWKLWRDAGMDGQPSESFIDDVRGLHVFDNLADWERVKTFTVKLTEDDRKFFTKRAEMGRDYFDVLLDKYKLFKTEHHE